MTGPRCRRKQRPSGRPGPRGTRVPQHPTPDGGCTARRATGAAGAGARGRDLPPQRKPGKPTAPGKGRPERGECPRRADRGSGDPEERPGGRPAWEPEAVRGGAWGRHRLPPLLPPGRWCWRPGKPARASRALSSPVDARAAAGAGPGPWEPRAARVMRTEVDAEAAGPPLEPGQCAPSVTSGIAVDAGQDPGDRGQSSPRGSGRARHRTPGIGGRPSPRRSQWARGKTRGIGDRGSGIRGGGSPHPGDGVWGGTPPERGAGSGRATLGRPPPRPGC